MKSPVPSAWQSLVEFIHGSVKSLLNRQIGGLYDNAKQNNRLAKTSFPKLPNIYLEDFRGPKNFRKLKKKKNKLPNITKRGQSQKAILLG